jgi:hypothetical protein
MHLKVTSQGQPILGTSLALEDPEVNSRPMAPPFDVGNFPVWLAASLGVWVWVTQ